MKVSVLNKSDKPLFIEVNKDKVIPIGGKQKMQIDVENDLEMIELQKKYRKKLVFRKI